MSSHQGFQLSMISNNEIMKDCIWWRLTGSNRRPPACKAGALPAELNPQILYHTFLVSLVGLEPTTPALSTRCSNQLSYRPVRISTNQHAQTSLLACTLPTFTVLLLLNRPISVNA